VYDLKLAWGLCAMKVACPTFQRFLSPPSEIFAVIRVVQVHVVSTPLGHLRAHWPARVDDLRRRLSESSSESSSTMKLQVFWDMLLCDCTSGSRCSKRTQGLQNVGNHTPSNTASYSRRPLETMT